LIRYGASHCVAESEVEIDNDEINVTFVAYSGGGQMAYATAQKLKGRVFVDNLVMFGASFLAYNGMSNIGRLWDFVGEQDAFYARLGTNVLSWDVYNRGYRDGRGISGAVDRDRYNIYKHGATRCVLLGDSQQPYGHFSYFDKANKFQGLTCQGYHEETISQQHAQQINYTRFDANVTFLKGILEGTLK
jgi:hypothetical protein